MSVKAPLILEFDGLCEPRNPGGVACYGWLVRDGEGGPRVAEGRGVYRAGPGATNNGAEYAALGFGLRWLADHPPGPGAALLIRGDSQLVCEQLAGRWACNAPRLQQLRARCLELLGGIEWHIEWVPRGENHEADELSRKAYREHTGKEAPTRRARA